MATMMRCNSWNAKARHDLPQALSSFTSRDQVNTTCTIPLIPLERVYDGFMGGFLTLKSRVHLRIASDGSLDGEIRQTQQENVHSIVNCSGKKEEKKKKKVRQGSTGHVDEIVIAHVVGNAQVVPIEKAVVSQATPTSYNDTLVAEYCCAFEVMERFNDVDRHTLTCHLHVPVAPDAAAVGTWQFRRQGRQPLNVSSSAATSETRSMARHVMQVIEEQNVFQLEPVPWDQRQQEAEQLKKEALIMQTRPSSLLYPLRPGTYEFKGFTTNNTPDIVDAVVPRQRNGRRDRRRPAVTIIKDKCWVTLRLLPDGTLCGTSREALQPQVCQLKGRWHVNRVAYVLEYRVREAVGHFRYSGAVVIAEGGAGMSNGNKTKAKSSASSSSNRREMLCGKWHNVDEDHDDGYKGGRGEFKLELVRVKFKPLAVKTEKDFRHEQQRMLQGTGSRGEDAIVIDDDDAIHAFTSGEYKLSGCATDADGYEYAFDLKVELRPGGKLLGWSKERIFRQTNPVFGCWGPSRIVYGQQYVVRREVGMYTYTADMSPDGTLVRGTWANIEADFASAPSEHGTVALILADSTRQWSTFSHPHYPLRFRQGVLATLMASAKTHKLPGLLWTHVFAFCSETWFTPSF